jgi:hypothetical protein
MAKSAMQKLMETPKMRAYVKEQGFRDEVGWYPPVEFRQVTEAEYWAHVEAKRLDMQRRRERLLAMKS